MRGGLDEGRGMRGESRRREGGLDAGRWMQPPNRATRGRVTRGRVKATKWPCSTSGREGTDNTFPPHAEAVAVAAAEAAPASDFALCDEARLLGKAQRFSAT